MGVKKQCLRFKDLFVNRVCYLAEPGMPVIKIQIARRYRWFRRQLRLVPQSRANDIERATGTLVSLEFATRAYKPELVASIGADEWPAWPVCDIFREHRVLVTVVESGCSGDLQRVLSMSDDDMSGPGIITRAFSKYKAAKRWSESGGAPGIYQNVTRGVRRSFFQAEQLGNQFTLF